MMVFEILEVLQKPLSRSKKNSQRKSRIFQEFICYLDLSIFVRINDLLENQLKNRICIFLNNDKQKLIQNELKIQIRETIYQSTVYMLIPLFIYFFLSWWIQQLYVQASRELQRLESISKSPILSLFGECINGQSYMKVFKKESKFIEKLSDNMDVNRKVFLEMIEFQVWFMLILGLVKLFVNAQWPQYIVYFILFLFLLWQDYYSYMQHKQMEMFQNVFKHLVNYNWDWYHLKDVWYLERLNQQQQVLNNHLQESHFENYLDHWPKQGRIDYINYSVRYREGLKPALKNLNFTIDPQDKIGVIGRTVAGKSTVTLTLLRILEALDGKIVIDNVDISTISLKQLREHITMIMKGDFERKHLSFKLKNR
ncbi:unnamed protein product [Paramecium sonneborni]|uniref:ABC transmembrane type-1 domain-containing protein n=1 Tax=Paramecium sonneborni TaxID=65129 RepID=A0A8S1QY37_9CILI|nr:unnamed protein product [Paramecium sonneborni]